MKPSTCLVAVKRFIQHHIVLYMSFVPDIQHGKKVYILKRAVGVVKMVISYFPGMYQTNAHSCCDYTVKISNYLFWSDSSTTHSWLSLYAGYVFQYVYFKPQIWQSVIRCIGRPLGMIQGNCCYYWPSLKGTLCFLGFRNVSQEDINHFYETHIVILVHWGKSSYQLQQIHNKVLHSYDIPQGRTELLDCGTAWLWIGRPLVPPADARSSTGMWRPRYRVQGGGPGGGRWDDMPHCLWIAIVLMNGSHSLVPRCTYPISCSAPLWNGDVYISVRRGALWGVGGVHCAIFEIGRLVHDTPFCYLFSLISVTPA